MDCANHAGVTSIDPCDECQRPFCIECLVIIARRPLCAECRRAFRNETADGQVRGPDGKIVCKDARDALLCSVFGLFCCGAILPLVGIYLALRARRRIATNPDLSGSGQATAALIVGVVGFAIWIVSVVGYRMGWWLT